MKNLLLVLILAASNVFAVTTINKVATSSSHYANGLKLSGVSAEALTRASSLSSTASLGSSECEMIGLPLTGLKIGSTSCHHTSAADQTCETPVTITCGL